jgi:hypothetical protein
MIRVLGAVLLLGLWACQANQPTPTIGEEAQRDSNATSYRKDDLFEGKKAPMVNMGPLLYHYEPGDSLRLYEALTKLSSLPAKPQAYRLSRTALHGYRDSIFILECQYLKDSICEHYPHVQQFLFDAQANFLMELRASTLAPIRVQESQAPMLLVAETNCQGAGGHQVLKWESGALVNVLSPIDDNYPPTLRPGQRSEWQLKDLNRDSLNDLVFVLGDGEDKKAGTQRIAFFYKKSKDMFLYAK